MIRHVSRPTLPSFAPTAPSRRLPAPDPAPHVVAKPQPSPQGSVPARAARAPRLAFDSGRGRNRSGLCTSLDVEAALSHPPEVLFHAIEIVVAGLLAGDPVSELGGAVRARADRRV